MLLKKFELPGVDDHGARVHLLNKEADMTKIAGDQYSPEIQKFAETIQPSDERIVVLVNALGAGEYYGSNNNGDFFPDAALQKYANTFYDAYPYKHHVNKDPKKAYGRILFVSYNPRMHRVELVMEISKEKAPDIVERIEGGEFPEVSMGCKCPFDVCSVCGHKSAKVSEYCKHLREQMNQIVPGGKRVCAITPHPRWFDLSFVFRGADRTAKTLSKVANEGGAIPSAILGDEYYTADEFTTFEKAASERKLDEEEKIAYDAMMGMMDDFTEKYVPLLEKGEPSIKRETLNKMARENDMAEIISTTAGMGMVLKPEEFQRIVLVKGAMEHVADEWDRQGVVFPTDVGLFEKATPEPHLVEDKYFNEKLAESLSGYVPHRSANNPHFIPRVVQMSKRAAQVARIPEKEIPDPGILPLLGFLGLGYMAYRKVVPLAHMNKFDQFLVKNPKVAIPVLGLTAATIMGAGEVVGPEKTAMSKEAASLPIPFPGFTIPVGLSYIYGAHTRKRAAQGQPVGELSALIATHPFSAGVTGALAVAATRNKSLLAKLKRATKGETKAAPLVKGAEDGLLHPQELGKLAGFAGDTLAEYLAFGSFPGAILDNLLFKAIGEAAKGSAKKGEKLSK